MPEIKLDPTVAELSPNLYKAAISANLPKEQQKYISQMTRTHKLGKKLIQQSEEEARKQFLELEPIVQDNMRYLFPDQKRFQPEQNLVGKAVNFAGEAVKDVATAYLSPVIALFTAADKWGKTINTPYKVKAQVKDEGKPFSKQVLSDAFNGKNSWRWDRVANYEKKYGKALTTLARALSEGRTPGEAIDLYGGLEDGEMLNAIRYMGDNPEKFEEFKKELKQGAQVSPGRDRVESMLMADPDIDTNYWAYKFLKKIGIDLKTKKGLQTAKSIASGSVDGVYQIAVDPLTYTGVGPILKGTKAIGKGIAGVPEAVARFGGIKTRGQRLTDQFQFLAERGDINAGMDFVFRQNDVIKLWDGQLGPAIKEYADAPTPYLKGQVYRKIKQEFPEWANLSTVKLFAKYEAFDAQSAKKFFVANDDMASIANGRVDGISWRRNAIPVSSQFRGLQSSIVKTVDAIFNPSAKNASIQDFVKRGEEELATAVDVLKKVAINENELINPNVADIFELRQDVTTTRKNLQKIGTLLGRNPGPILYGDDAVKTSEDVRSLARSILPRDVADGFVEVFLDEPAEIQLTMVRNLYAATMMKVGMLGTPGGRQVADEILGVTFNETGMYSTVRSEVPQAFAELLHPASIRRTGEVFEQASKGIVQPSQVAKSIAPLPYDLLYQTAATSRLSERVNFINAIGGTTRNKFVKAYTDFWSNFTLFPRLGIRSAVDEAFFFFITAPTTALRNFVAGGRGGRAAVESFSGSKSAQGMYKRGFFKAAENLGIKIDPTKKLSGADRLAILKEAQKIQSARAGYEVPLSDVSTQLIREETVERLQSIYRDTMPKETWATLTRLMKHAPNVLDSMANSMAARSMMNGQFSVDYIDSIFVKSNLDIAVNEKGLVFGRKYRDLNISDMLPDEIAIVHFDNWNLRFSYNIEKIIADSYVSPVAAFFENKALKTPQDLVNARNDILKIVGVDTVPGGNADDYLIADEGKLKGFLSLFSSTVYYRQQGIPDIQIARIHTDAMLMDMRNTFHGRPDAYNEKLFNEIDRIKTDLVAKAFVANKPITDPWSSASAELEFNKFFELTKDFQPNVNVRTRLYSHGETKDMKVFEEGTGFPYLYSKFQNWTMEVMDSTVTGLYRQPALLVFTQKALQDLAPYEREFVKRYTNQMRSEYPDMPINIIKERARNHAEKQVTELALSRATDEILEFVDNPAVRTNLAVSVRSVARYYRATEDFYRRVWRLYSKNPLRAIYRLRLLNTGLQASGDVYEDEKGDAFIVFPTDGIINGAVEPILRTLTGNPGFQVPSFNEFTLKLRLTNPSFSPEAGQPALAGPIAGLGVVTVRALLRELPLVPSFIKDRIQGKTTELSDVLDTLALGQFGDRMTIKQALLPMLGDSVLSSLLPAELDRQKGTALVQAISYTQAFGNGLSPNATPQERFDYLQGLKASTNSIIVARNMLGQISPGQPTLRDAKGLPGFLKDTGLTSWKASFWDVYNGILRNGGEDVGDAFDLAVSTWIGKNPGKLVYLVPRNTKAFKTLIATTDNLKKWSIDNKKFLDVYSEVGYIFAPKSGEYNPDVYTFLQAEGLVDIPNFKTYLEDVLIAEDKQRYFEIDAQLDEALTTKATYIDRRIEIDKAEKERKALLISNPLLDDAINGGSKRGNLQVMFNNLSSAVVDPKSPISNATRSYMNLAVKTVSNFLTIAQDPDMESRWDFTDIKAQEKQKAVEILKELSKQSPEVKEANRIIFTGLMNAYSRDSVKAGIER